MGRKRVQKGRTPKPQGKPEGRDPLEWTKLIFDFYKHIATLSGVGAAVMLTVYQQEIINREDSGTSLVLFGVGILCCSWGMLRLLVHFPLSPGSGQTTDIPLLAQFAGSFFAQAVVVAVATAFDLPMWPLIIIVVVLFLALSWTLSGRTIFGYGLPRS